MSEDANARLSEGELMSQLQCVSILQCVVTRSLTCEWICRTLMVAGQETTASTSAWALYELSRHPEIQTRVREEVRAARAHASKRGNGELTVTDLDSMKWLLAVMKVSQLSVIYMYSPSSSAPYMKQLCLGNTPISPYCHNDYACGFSRSCLTPFNASEDEYRRGHHEHPRQQRPVCHSIRCSLQ
jgi:Cytochrome P450